MGKNHKRKTGLTRRGWLTSAAAALSWSVLAPKSRSEETEESNQIAPPEGYRIKNGRIKQAVYGWCFQSVPIDQFIGACHRMGVSAINIGRQYVPQLKERGMNLAMLSSHSFKTGPFNVDNHAHCIEKLREGIDAAAEYGVSDVITFTGMREKGVSDYRGERNCIECWKKVIGYAEKKQVNLCLEQLNTRDDSHPMKGHPGYFGDDVDFCIELIKKVDSPRMKLLFDVYHAQVMNGDVIRRIRQYKDYIGHYHVAGVPGRGELDDTQELNFPAIMRVILETGYTGYVTQEFIPTWKDPLTALRHAVRVCDV